MGQNLILNMNDHGFTVVAFNRTVDKVDEFLAKEAKGTKVIGAHSIEEMVASSRAAPRHDAWSRPASPWTNSSNNCSRTSNPATSSSTAAIRSSKTPNRRVKYVESKGLLYIGTGVSGGEEGARHGPSIMPGGSPAAWPHVKAIFQAISAKVEGRRSLLRLGRRTAAPAIT